MIVQLLVLLVWLLSVLPAQAVTYYIDDNGSNANNGTSSVTPWKTFAFAIGSGANKAGCDDTLIVMNGNYGDGGTSGTDKFLVNNLTCTFGHELTVVAETSRQATIGDTQGTIACDVEGSAYIIVDGLYCKSADNAARTASEQGVPIMVKRSSHITLRNSVAYNTNRYASTASISIYYTADSVFEDNEVYRYHRHAFNAFKSERIRITRGYCNPREGRIAGGFLNDNPVGSGDACVSMYPCDMCIAENMIGDGTSGGLYMMEQNASNSAPSASNATPYIPGPVKLRESKLLGSVCYKCNFNHQVFPNTRAAGIDGSPQGTVIQDFVSTDWAPSTGYSGIRMGDCVGCTVDHVTIRGTDVASIGMSTFDRTTEGGGATAAQNSVTVTNTIFQDVQTGFSIAGFNTTVGNKIWLFSLTGSGGAPGHWTNVVTTNPGYGTCKLWLPDGAAAKGAASDGSDPGATVLYRWVGGVKTTTPLWDPVTGAFPYGAATPDNINRVVGQSLFDIHTRLNVNTGGCSFPAGYGDTPGGGGGSPSTVIRGTTVASGLSTTASPLSWGHTIAANQDLLLVCIGLWHSGATVGSVSGVDVSGQAMTLVKRQVTSPDAYRAAELWKLATPTSGLRTITATITGSLSGILGRSTEFDITGGTNTAAGASTVGPATTLSVTAATNTNERVEDCTVSSKSATYTHGADQTGDTDLDHSTQSLKLATSTQNGSDGGDMSNSTGTTVLQAKVAVSLLATPEDPPSTAVLTQSKFIFIYPIGTEAGAPVVLVDNPSPTDKNITLQPNGLVRIRAEIIGSVATSTSFSAALYCRKDGGSYTKVTNSVGTHGLLLLSSGSPGDTSDIPAHLTPTTCRLTGGCTAGAMIRSDSESYTVPALTSGSHIELDTVVAASSASGVIDCRYAKDDGSSGGVALDTYAVTPQITIVPTSAGMGR